MAHFSQSWFKQTAKFAVVGISNTLIDIGTYLFLTHFILLFSQQLILAKSLSYSIGVINSFYWNRKWTFQSEVGYAKGLLLYLLINLTSISVNIGVMYLSLNIIGFHHIVSLLLATASTFFFNLSSAKLLVFRK
jgi:putative flippase GtrA